MAFVVYMHKNKINGKIYIGQSFNVEKRWSNNGQRYKGCTYFYNAIQKYGWSNFEHIILKEGLTQEEADYWEEYYIQYYHTLNDLYGYNLSQGGVHKGSLPGEKNKKNKKIICLETQKIYPSARIAGQELNIDESCIRKVCRGKRASAGGLHWADYIEGEIYEIETTLARGKCNTLPVLCIETQCLFNSATEAAKEMGLEPSLVGRVCRGVQITTGGYHFQYITKRSELNE